MTAEKLWTPFKALNAFPVLQPGHQPQEYIPYNIIAPHEAQAMKNHGQSLQRLSERGGLSWGEIWAVINDKSWKELGWGPLCSKEADAREEKAKENVLAYIKERRPPCGCQ